MSDNGRYSGDTQVDVRSPWAQRVRLKPRPASAPRVRPSAALPGVSRHSDPGNTLKSASLAQVVCRETIVRRNRELALAQAGAQPTPPSLAPSTAPVRVPIDWARSDDHGLRLELVGRDGFRITGLGGGLGATGAGAKVGLGVEGRIHRVSVPVGADAATSLEALLLSLRRFYRVEITEISPGRAAARIVGRRPSHT